MTPHNAAFEQDVQAATPLRGGFLCILSLSGQRKYVHMQKKSMRNLASTKKFFKTCRSIERRFFFCDIIFKKRWEMIW